VFSLGAFGPAYAPAHTAGPAVRRRKAAAAEFTAGQIQNPAFWICLLFFSLIKSQYGFALTV
jgi:hypothetical protein